MQIAWPRRPASNALPSHILLDHLEPPALQSRLNRALRAFVVASLPVPSAVLAQDASRVLTEPSLAILRSAPAAAAPHAHVLTEAAPAPPPAAPPGASEVYLDLNVQYADSTIYNPATGRNDPVRLRTYVDAGATAAPAVTFVAPTIVIEPGQTVRISLNNRLPAEPNCAMQVPNVNIPHCFNVTNLHAHGLWVSPAGNSDNVLLSINPGVQFQYEYNVPPDHPAGTFWYHAHHHGSTALQVSSGIAGALIIRGTRPPTSTANGDIDTILMDAGDANKPFRERVVLLQQIQYACRDAKGAIKTDANGAYVCDPGDVGGIEGYDQFGPGTWPTSGRYTTINGLVLPTFPEARVGQVERWRLIHAGVRDTIKLAFRKMKAAQPAVPSVVGAQAQWITENCTGPEVTQFDVASDGLTRGQIVQRPQTVLQPGYREDLLMIFPEAGTYCVIDDAAPNETTVNQQVKGRRLLGFVQVAGDQPVILDPAALLKDKLVAAAKAAIPEPARSRVVSDLDADLKLSAFTPHPDIADSEVLNTQTLAFNINVQTNPPTFMIDGRPYDPNRIDRTLVLGTADRWVLTSNLANHPFHIHVNPFQITQIIDPTGKDVSVTGEPDDPQYANLKGAWKDSLFVKQGYVIEMRTRYQRYIGDFVLHCHILDHEDQGMMQNIRIAIPDGQGGVAHAH
jgi:L-ascorbate oxidase